MPLRMFAVHEEGACKPNRDLCSAYRVFDIARQGGWVESRRSYMRDVCTCFGFDEVLTRLHYFLSEIILFIAGNLWRCVGHSLSYSGRKAALSSKYHKIVVCGLFTKLF